MKAFTIPNLLTYARIILTMVFFAMGLRQDWDTAVFLFAIAAFTDLIDGSIAKLLGQTSRLGAFLDPMADKLMMLAGVMILTIQGLLPWWLMTLIVGRDLVIVFGLFYLMAFQIRVEYRPTTLSKATTFCQIMVVVMGLLEALVRSHAVFPAWLQALAAQLAWAIWVTAALTLITALQYMAIGIKVLRSGKAGTS